MPNIFRIGGPLYSTSLNGNTLSIPGLAEIADVGDILIVSSNGINIRSYLSSKTQTNTILVTEACENRCVFCSQPPRESVSLYQQAWEAIQAFAPPCTVGITGGEPTLFWSDFITFCNRCGADSSGKSFHVLTHGRNLSPPQKVQEVLASGFLHKSLWGIPIHGDDATHHDSATGIAGSFQETMSGLINLAFAGAAIELRVILTAQNVTRLKGITRLINTYLRGANLFFAFMNLEPVGWAKSNLKTLRISPDEWANSLEDAVSDSVLAGTPVSLYNFPLCHLSDSLKPFAQKSISDWKNYFPVACKSCKLKDDCCGFFASATGSRLFSPKPVT